MNIEETDTGIVIHTNNKNPISTARILPGCVVEQDSYKNPVTITIDDVHIIDYEDEHPGNGDVVAYIKFRDNAVLRTEVLSPSIFLDYNDREEIVGVEFI